MEKIIGIIDEPNPRGSADELGIDRHAKALIEFIKKAPTPLTIGIQGEWGSGKTSILNSIYYELNEAKCYKQIWVNSWESSLLSTPGEALLKIINEIVGELIGSDKGTSKQESIKNITSAIFKGALRVGASIALGDKASEVASELMSGRENSIKELRNSLDALSQEIRDRTSNPYNKIIVYIDDLDRIEPQYAVQILELLKNIFNISGCIFILAIDYQVVVKGLQHKFGKRTEENEWEFRAFFDKIIQLPFMMPMGQYDIGRYVKNLLQKVGFLTDEDIPEDTIKQIISYTIGGNPRSLKRLANSLALIDIFIKIGDDNNTQNDDIDKETKKILLLAFVCIQIAYPDIYSLFSKNPDFTTWNEKFAQQVTRRKEEDDKENFEKSFSIAKESGEDFDEEWELALYRICYTTPKYRAKAAELSKLLSLIKDDILAAYEDQFVEIIQNVLGETNVTSVASSDNVQEIQTTKYSRIRFDSWEEYEANMKQQDLENNTKHQSLSIAKKIIEFAIEQFGNTIKIVYTDREMVTLQLAEAKGRKKVFVYMHLRKKPVVIVQGISITENNFETECKTIIINAYNNFVKSELA